MIKKLIPIAMLPLLMMVAFASCEKTDHESVVPQFSSITCSPSSPKAGDSITVVAHQAIIGKLINSTTYKWSFTYINPRTYTDTTVVKTVQIIYDMAPTDPMMGFRIPAGTPRSSLTVSISANYSLSGQTATGQIYGSASKSAHFSVWE